MSEDTLTPRVDFFQLTVERIHKVPAGWKWCNLNSHNMPEDFIEVKGAVPDGTYKSGKRKGRPKFPKIVDTFFIRRSQLNETASLWEQETGLCEKCQGACKVVVSWSSTTGSKYEKCSKCKGTGKEQ